ncbi:MAG TPA: hypothetical protein VHG28_06845 [Longimicrobiaceae bacterium]|nr:hypothetical protein [Longimicrobiaceae bacterium]
MQKQIGRVLFGAAVLGALGLGASQAFASTEPRDATARACNDSTCFNNCVARGYDSGECIRGFCRCF